MTDRAELVRFLEWLDEEGYVNNGEEYPGTHHTGNFEELVTEYLRPKDLKMPTVGSKVIYYSDDLGAVEAIVTRVRPHLKVELVIVHYETPSVEAVHYSASPGRIDYTWHWPEESKDIWPDHHAAAIKEASS